MKVLTPFEGLAILGIFAVVMFAVAWAKMGRDVQRDTFLVANRDVSLVSGSFSIAASWIWAPAVFICSMQAYDKGLPGIFWFTAPNILCFFLSIPTIIVNWLKMVWMKQW